MLDDTVYSSMDNSVECLYLILSTSKKSSQSSKRDHEAVIFKDYNKYDDAPDDRYAWDSGIDLVLAPRGRWFESCL